MDNVATAARSPSAKLLIAREIASLWSRKPLIVSGSGGHIEAGAASPMDMGPKPAYSGFPLLF
ncbi:MAG: hypothetical protein JXB36_01510 [Gammaproteobacteria bacterium]|nr:hypothetical protein [Gammaproteobacteria bacterium]